MLLCVSVCVCVCVCFMFLHFISCGHLMPFSGSGVDRVGQAGRRAVRAMRLGRAGRVDGQTGESARSDWSGRANGSGSPLALSSNFVFGTQIHGGSQIGILWVCCPLSIRQLEVDPSELLRVWQQYECRQSICGLLQ
jgi:hypothetical protein